MPFTSEAIRTMAQVSQGVPRVLNVICDNALMQAFADDSATVEQRHIVGVCNDLRLAVASPAPAPAAPVQDPVAAPVTGGAGYPMKTLERYDTSKPKVPLLARLACKLGFAQRVEAA